jgi:hypothetical protein
MIIRSETSDKNLFIKDLLGREVVGFYGSVFTSHDDTRQEISEYEFVFDDKTIFRVCLGHEGLVLYEGSIYDQDYSYGSYKRTEITSKVKNSFLRKLSVVEGVISGMAGGTHQLYLLLDKNWVCFEADISNSNFPEKIIFHEDLSFEMENYVNELVRIAN